MKLTSLIIAMSIAGAHAGARTDLEATLDPMSKPVDCFDLLANGVEFNRNGVIRRAVRVDTANEQRNCVEFDFEPFNRFGIIYCTADIFGIGPTRLYDADHPNIGGKTIDEYVAGLCTDYSLDGEDGGWPVPLYSSNPCAGSEPESINNDAENFKAGYYARTGFRITRAFEGLQSPGDNVTNAVIAERRNVLNVHGIHTFEFAKTITNGVITEFSGQIVAVAKEEALTGTTGTIPIVGGTGKYLGAQGYISYENFRNAASNNKFKICLLK
eukprot:scaffold40867_cov65-Cyclotella_meneghiniana.AAC.1